ncbi:MAG: hypothetical protein M3144_08085 [Actinomycetota bacterium]|nr:hypothetical protein [Actinomycetota bacterium]
MSAPTATQPRTEPAAPRLDLPDPISLVPVVVAILFAVVGVWALAWLAWIP